jgi:hypothetical protein
LSILLAVFFEHELALFFVFLLSASAILAAFTFVLRHAARSEKKQERNENRVGPPSFCTRRFCPTCRRFALASTRRLLELLFWERGTLQRLSLSLFSHGHMIFPENEHGELSIIS